MKKILHLLSIIGFISILTGCLPSGSESVVDYWCYYNVTLNVVNETNKEISIETQPYVIDNVGNHLLRFYGSSLKTVSSKSSEQISELIAQEFTNSEYLSHIITIDGKNFAGFEEKFVEIEDYVDKTQKSVSAVKWNLGSVNWRDSKYPVISYEGKTFETDEKHHIITLIYDIVIKDEADILESEKEDFTDGIKITVTHEVK